MSEDKKPPYYRWHPAKADPCGNNRGADQEMLEGLNRTTMELIEEEARHEYAAYLAGQSAVV